MKNKCKRMIFFWGLIFLCKSWILGVKGITLKLPHPPDVIPTLSTTTIKLPNSTLITATEKGYIPLHSSLNEAATQVKIIPQLTNSSFLSIGQLCDNNCLAIFHKKYLTIFKNNKVILQGIRNISDGLWDIQFDKINQIISWPTFITVHCTAQLLLPYVKLSEMIILSHGQQLKVFFFFFFYYFYHIWSIWSIQWPQT